MANVLYIALHQQDGTYTSTLDGEENIVGMGQKCGDRLLAAYKTMRREWKGPDGELLHGRVPTYFRWKMVLSTRFREHLFCEEPKNA